LFRARAIALGRAVLAVAAFYALFFALGVAAERVQDLVVGPRSWWRLAGRGLLGLAVPSLIAVGAVYAGLVAVADRRPSTWGWPVPRVAVRGIVVGMGWGVGLAGVAVVLCIAGGAELLVRPAADERFAVVALPLAVGLAAAALLEELLFRGFPLARLREVTGRIAASIALALLFAGAHLRNPSVSPVGLVNIALAALLLSAAFFSRGGLATAFGLHFGWNAGLVFGADAPVSGLRFGLPALEFVPGPRTWWTGGGFGPEGGLAATFVLAGALWWWVRAVRMTEVVG
jgi:membrane protease YdiL (CAAX protease family)